MGGGGEKKKRKKKKKKNVTNIPFIWAGSMDNDYQIPQPEGIPMSSCYKWSFYEVLRLYREYYLASCIMFGLFTENWFNHVIIIFFLLKIYLKFVGEISCLGENYKGGSDRVLCGLRPLIKLLVDLWKLWHSTAAH